MRFSNKLKMVHGPLRSWWSHVEKSALSAPSLKEAFAMDIDRDKISLRTRVCGDDSGKIYMFSAVKKACERIVTKDLDHEYCPVAGLPDFCQLALSLVLGKDSHIIEQGHHATVQTLAGTGAYCLASAFINTFFEGAKEANISQLAWNHFQHHFAAAGIPTSKYRFFDVYEDCFNLKATLEDISKMSYNSIILFQASGANPTGIDPNLNDWVELSKAVKNANLLPIFDTTYQGITSGNLTRDALPVRIFLEDNHQPIIIQSFSKNMGLYGERVGALTFITKSKPEANILNSQLQVLIQSIYSAPPVFGARIVSEILKDPDLHTEWMNELHDLHKKLQGAREHLIEKVEKENEKDWTFPAVYGDGNSLTDFSRRQALRLKTEFCNYFVQEGKLIEPNHPDDEYIAKAIRKLKK